MQRLNQWSRKTSSLCHLEQPTSTCMTVPLTLSSVLPWHLKTPKLHLLTLQIVDLLWREHYVTGMERHLFHCCSSTPNWSKVFYNPPLPVTLNAFAAYLSGKAMPGMNPNSSLFTQALQASDRLRMMWNFDKNRSISLTTHRVLIILNRSKVFKSLRENFGSVPSYSLKSKSNQGKTLPCFQKSKISAHYNRTGHFIKFTDWRFVHKARLYLLPLNAVRPINLLWTLVAIVAPIHSRFCPMFCLIIIKIILKLPNVMTL